MSLYPLSIQNIEEKEKIENSLFSGNPDGQTYWLRLFLGSYYEFVNN